MKVVEKISEVIEKNSFNEFADFDKKIERRERLIQVLFVILSLLVSYNGDSFLHGNLIRLYLIFVLFAMLYYVALPVSIDKYVNALDIAKKQNADNLSSLKNIADTLYTFTEQLADNENSLKSLDEQIANIENSLGAINVEPKFVKVFEWAKSERIAWGKRGDWLRSAILDTVERKGWLQSENLAFAARLDQHRMVLNLNRFFLFLLGSFVACVFSFFLFFFVIGISDGYVHSFPLLYFIGYVAVAIFVSKALYI